MSPLHQKTRQNPKKSGLGFRGFSIPRREFKGVEGQGQAKGNEAGCSLHYTGLLFEPHIGTCKGMKLGFGEIFASLDTSSKRALPLTLDVYQERACICLLDLFDRGWRVSTLSLKGAIPVLRHVSPASIYFSTSCSLCFSMVGGKT